MLGIFNMDKYWNYFFLRDNPVPVKEAFSSIFNHPALAVYTLSQLTLTKIK